MTQNNKFTNTEEELKKLEEFGEQIGKVETSFDFLYGNRFVRRVKRDNFNPQSVEKLLTNVLLGRERIIRISKTKIPKHWTKFILCSY